MTLVSITVNLAVEVSLNSKTKSKKPSSFRHRDMKARGGRREQNQIFLYCFPWKLPLFVMKSRLPRPNISTEKLMYGGMGWRKHLPGTAISEEICSTHKRVHPYKKKKITSTRRGLKRTIWEHLVLLHFQSTAIVPVLWVLNRYRTIIRYSRLFNTQINICLWSNWEANALAWRYDEKPGRNEDQRNGEKCLLTHRNYLM